MGCDLDVSGRDLDEIISCTRRMKTLPPATVLQLEFRSDNQITFASANQNY